MRWASCDPSNVAMVMAPPSEDALQIIHREYGTYVEKGM